jgi:uncharacterized protein YcbK (DUF882 family)
VSVLIDYKHERIDPREGCMTVEKRILLFVLVVCLGVTVGPSVPDAADTALQRFFLVGDGRLLLKNEKDGRSVEANLIGADGTVNEETRRKADSIFGASVREGDPPVSLRLLFLLDYFSDKVAPGSAIHVVSGYRSPAYNEGLKKAGGNVAKTSLHMDGMAVDFFIEGVDGKRLWEMIRQQNCCGVGHYGGRSVHLDTGRPRFWEAATSGVQTGQSDFNRRISLLTEYDRYAPGEAVRLVLTSISDFGFGVATTGAVIRDGEGEAGGAGGIPFSLRADPGLDCIPIKNRQASQSVVALLPRDLPAGMHRLRLSFCSIPYKEMPLTVVSNPVEITVK